LADRRRRFPGSQVPRFPSGGYPRLAQPAQLPFMLTVPECPLPAVIVPLTEPAMPLLVVISVPASDDQPKGMLDWNVIVAGDSPSLSSFMD
jgi:hypothetical protein